MFNHKTVNVKSVTTLLSLSLEKGDSFILQVQGKKAKDTLETLVTHFETLMKNDTEQKSVEKKAHDYEGNIIQGESIFGGIALAPLYVYQRKEIAHEKSMEFPDALQKSIEELETLYLSSQNKESAAIYLAQKELLCSLGEKASSLSVFEQDVLQASETLLGTKLDSKRADYQDILQRVKKHLGVTIEVTLPDTPYILLSDDLLPSEIDQLTNTAVQGVILQETSLSSHTAILLRAAGIVSLITKMPYSHAQTPLILDAHAGVVVYAPSENDVKKARDAMQKIKDKEALHASRRFDRAHTLQGKEIKVLSNVSDYHSAKSAKEEGAQGIGLLRSEFLFKSQKPSIETQQDAYAKIFSLFDDITVRTLDVGGDKALPYIQIPLEQNPFLGIRGIRLLESHPSILEEQLQAIFRAAKRKAIKIMFPMVSTVEEFNRAKALAQNIAQKEMIDISHIQFGIMIEVPSVLFLLESFNDVVDFYSIGTNDLTQYLFATERTHPTLKVDIDSPVIFSAIETILQKASKPVSICGELAADTTAIPKLLSLGIQTLSVSPKSIAQTKETIRHV